MDANRDRLSLENMSDFALKHENKYLIMNL